MKSISVFGLGYVGAVTAACLAHKGHKVHGVDLNPEKVRMLKTGTSPVLEPGLQELVSNSHEAGRLLATGDPAAAIRESEISFLCVGTPSQRNGRLDLSHVEHCCREVGGALRVKDDFHCIVVRSTVLPGTARSLIIPLIEAASGKREGQHFSVSSNPEFTREGSAVNDFLNPAITVLGAHDPRHLFPLREIYSDFPGTLFETPLEAAEMVKYMCNAFHALKVTFANEMGTLCQQWGVDIRKVVEVFAADTRLNISAAYLKPGFAYGGSCLPKDLCALMYRAKELDVDLPLLRAITHSNEAHLDRAIEVVLSTGCKKIGLIGLSFKAGTDDLRESPLVKMVKRLLGEGRQIRIWDPIVQLGHLTGTNRQFIEHEIPHIGSLFCQNVGDLVKEAELVLIGTPDGGANILPFLRSDQVVIDLLNLADWQHRQREVLTASSD